MTDLNIYLPFPPTVNSYYVKTRNGVFIGKPGTQFRKDVAECVNEQCSDVYYEEPISMTVILHMPDKRTRDLDNYMKALLDSLTQAKLWSDDSIIEHLEIYRGVDLKGGKARISITESGFRLPLEYWP